MKNKKFLAGLEETISKSYWNCYSYFKKLELEDIAGGEKIGKIFLKRTDLHHDSSHKPVSAFSSVCFAGIFKSQKIILKLELQ